jgi:hypothetical protein
LISLPNSFADLTALTILDLSHNSLTVVPDNLFALPELTSLNLSHNQLSSLPFNAPFKDSNRPKVNQQSSISFFGPVVTRSTAPLPRLVILDVSHNKISAQAIDSNFPVSLSKVDLSSNPLGNTQQLLRNLASLKRLKELRFVHAEIGDDSFPPSLFSSQPFPSLRLLDLEETLVHIDVVKEALQPMRQQMSFDFVNDEPPEGVIRVLVGKRIIQEPWEVELERRSKARSVTTVDSTDDWMATQPQKRSNSRMDTTSPAPSLTTKPLTKQEVNVVPDLKPKEVQKEDWEIAAEQGLATEGGRRRARAAAALAQNTKGDSLKDTSTPSSLGLSNSQYYTVATQTLHLPPSAPPFKIGHVRAHSVMAPVPASKLSSRTEDLTVPVPTLPLSIIVTQPFATTLRVLILSNRRMDKSFHLPRLPEKSTSFLPRLEELNLEGCSLNDLVSTVTSPDAGTGATTPPRSSESLIPLITRLFPSLVTLNLSHNAITNASLTPEALSNLILASNSRKGLRHLRLNGNKISELDGFSRLAESFKGNRQVPEWNLEELDIRDNEVAKLPPELGLLPLDVFLVDGNM